jgi:ketosteroid isomerase-like protein
VQRSQELLDAYTAMMRGGQDGTIPSVNEILSSSDVVPFIGTGGTGWAYPEQFAAAVDAEWAAYRQLGLRVDTSRAEAWTEGSFGFVVDSPIFTLRDGESVQLRSTTVFRKEGGSWKMVHPHVSVGFPADADAVKHFDEALEGAMAHV